MSFENPAFNSEPIQEAGRGRKNPSELDVRGREIFGLEPKPEKFSKLESGRDYSIVWQNPDITSSENLEEEFIFVNPETGEETRIVEAPHWRAISKDKIRAEAKTNQGVEPYYTITTKGVGYLKPTLKGKSIDDYEDWNRTDEYGFKGAYGLSEKRDYELNNQNLVEKTKFLTEAGLRTELYWAVAKVDQLYYQGKLVSVQELKNRGIIPKPKTWQPHLGVRLVKSDYRIAQANEASPERSREIFEKAFAVTNQENQDKKLGLPKIKLGNPESEKTYFENFFVNMGSNLAILLNLGYVYYHLHTANVTMAAEIVDTGPLAHWKTFEDDEDILKKYAGVRRGNLKDIRDTIYDLKVILEAARNAGISTPDIKYLKKSFLGVIQSKFNPENKKVIQGNDAENTLRWIEAIFEAVLEKGQHLKPLKHAGVEDWPIEINKKGVRI